MKEYRSISDTEVEVKLSVTPSERGMRLDRFIQHLIPRLSRQRVQNIIDETGVFDQDGKAGKASRIVKVGDVFTWHREVVADTSDIPELQVLYEDERLLIVDKPASVVVHPTAKVFRATVTAWLNENRPDAKIAHRLDRDTSGVFVCGKGEFSKYLKELFRVGKVKKTYLAIVRGNPEFDALDCKLALRLDEANPLKVKMCVDNDNGLPSFTAFKVLQRFGSYALVQCKPHTGRQHQLRIHLWALGHPIVGDKLYGVDDDIFREAADQGLTARVLAATGAARHLLHAAAIAMPMPDGSVFEIGAPLPEDMALRLLAPEHTQQNIGFADAPAS